FAAAVSVKRSSSSGRWVASRRVAGREVARAVLGTFTVVRELDAERRSRVALLGGQQTDSPGPSRRRPYINHGRAFGQGVFGPFCPRWPAFGTGLWTGSHGPRRARQGLSVWTSNPAPDPAFLGSPGPPRKGGVTIRSAISARSSPPERRPGRRLPQVFHWFLDGSR